MMSTNTFNEDDIVELKEGDIITWMWSREAHPFHKDPFYELDGKGMIHNSKLYDLYNTGAVRQDEDVSHFASRIPLYKAISLDDILVFDVLGNVAEFERAISKEESLYFNDKDILDLTHHNKEREYFYLRRDAKRCKDTILRELYLRMMTADKEFNLAQYNYNRATEAYSHLNRDIIKVDAVVL